MVDKVTPFSGYPMAAFWFNPTQGDVRQGHNTNRMLSTQSALVGYFLPLRALVPFLIFLK